MCLRASIAVSHDRTASSTMRVEVDRLAPQLELAGGEPRDVEQIVDEPA